MDDDKTRDIRIGNDERGRALDALGEHFTSGRLDHTEYEERVQLAAAAHTRSELDKLFGDLPEPTPFGSGSSAPALARDSSPAQAPRNSVQNAPGKKLIQTLNLFAGGGTLLLFLLLQVVFDVPNAWLVFIVFPLVLGGIRIGPAKQAVTKLTTTTPGTSIRPNSGVGARSSHADVGSSATERRSPRAKRCEIRVAGSPSRR